jgi:serine/threonine-protein kinase
MRVVEDPHRSLPEEDPQDRRDTDPLVPQVEGTAARARSLAPEGGTRSRVPPSLVRGRESQQEPSAEPDRPYIPMPPPTDPEVEAVVAQRRLFTEERNLLADAQRRRRMRAVAVALALVGAVCFALGAWHFSQRPRGAVDPKVSAVSAAVLQDKVHKAPPPPPPRPPPRQERPAEPKAPEYGLHEEPGGEESSRKGSGAWLSLKVNVPARASIDGVPVKRTLPLVRYPVKPGTRRIVVETLATSQREEFELRFERGQHRKLEQRFPPSPNKLEQRFPPSPRR